MGIILISCGKHVFSVGAIKHKSCGKDVFRAGAFKDMSCGKDVFSVGASKDKSCGKDVALFSLVIAVWRKQERRVTSGDERRSVSRRRERHVLSKWLFRVGASALHGAVPANMPVSRRRER